MMEERKVALSLIETVQGISILETFLRQYQAGDAIRLTENEKQALLMLLAQIREEASDDL